MKEQFTARMLRIHFGEDDRWHGKPLHEAILAKCVELGIAEAVVLRAQGGVTYRHHRRRARQSVDDRQFAHNRALTEESENALGTGSRHHRDFEQSVLDAIAAIAGIARQKQRRVGTELYRSSALEKRGRKMLGQLRQQAWTGTGKGH